MMVDIEGGGSRSAIIRRHSCATCVGRFIGVAGELGVELAGD